MTQQRPTRRSVKYQVMKRLLWAGNRLLVWALQRGIGPRAFVVLETTGRRSGQARRTPVGNGLDGDTFWLVSAHGHQADFVRNIYAHPKVRILVNRRWRTGTANLLNDDDTARRSRSLPYQWDAAIGRTIATTPLTVRIDLDSEHGTD